MSERNDMMEMAGRASAMIDALSNSLMSGVEVATEKIQLATQISATQMRMEAFGAVIEAIGAQKEPLLKRLETATGGMKILLERQLEMLTEQEVSVLERASVPKAVAKQIVGKMDKIYQRDGRRFAPIGSLNGIGGDGAKEVGLDEI